jgi:hypothetical protein
MLSSLTIRGWPRQVEAAQPIPHPFRRAFDALRLTRREAPSLLYSPRLRFGRHESTAKLLVRSGRRLACLDARHGGVVTTAMSLDDVHEVEWGQMLLQAWLRLVAHGPGGRAVIRVEFNAVGANLYQPVVEAARATSYAGTHLSLADERAKLAPLLAEDYRFVGFGRRALVTGAELVRHWFQPRLAGRVPRLLDRISVPALLLMVTQAELIAVQEQAVRGLGRYGAVWSCLPLRSIQRVALVPEPARRVVSLRVALPGDSELRADVDAAGQDALRAFLRQTDARWGEPTAPPVPPGPP